MSVFYSVSMNAPGDWKRSGIQKMCFPYIVICVNVITLSELVSQNVKREMDAFKLKKKDIKA